MVRKEYENGKRYKFGTGDSVSYEATFDGMTEEGLCRWKDIIMYSFPSTTPPSLAREVCEKCGNNKVGMWAGGNNSPRRIEYKCPKCEDLVSKVGQISD